jgi:predicted MFS family arabinose efflux permease
VREGADVPGAVLVTGALMLAVYTVVQPAAQHGWSSGQALGLGALSVVLLVGFVVRQATAQRPLMPPRLFRSRTTVGSNVVQMLTVAGMFGMFFLGSLYLQRILGYDPLQIGLAFLPTTVVMGVLSLRYSGPLALRYGARMIVIVGMLLIATALGLFTQAPVNGEYVAHVLPVMVLLGTGAGVAFPALMTLAMSDSSASDAGLASGLVNTTAQAGGALGLAVLATLSASRATQLRHHGGSDLAALNGGYHLAFWIAAGLVLIAVAVAATVLRRAVPRAVPEVHALAECAA